MNMSIQLNGPHLYTLALHFKLETAQVLPCYEVLRSLEQQLN